MKIENHSNINIQESYHGKTPETNKKISSKIDSKKLENHLNDDKKTLFKDKIITTAKNSPSIDSEKVLELKNKIKKGQYKIDAQNLSHSLIKNNLKDHFNI